MVYVLSKTGQPLMPTENHAKVRVLLKQQKAKVITNCPFTIQLMYRSTTYTEPVSLGIDAGNQMQCLQRMYFIRKKSVAIIARSIN